MNAEQRRLSNTAMAAASGRPSAQSSSVRRALHPVLFLLLCIAGPTAGQTPDVSSSAVRTIALEPGQRLRLSLDGRRVEGVLVRSDVPDLLVRVGDDGVERFSILEADSVWRRTSKAGRGILIGALLTSVPVALACVPEADECGLYPHGIYTVAAGALVGFIVGILSVEWRLLKP